MSLHDALRLFVGLYLIGALALFGRLVAHKVAFVRRGGPEDRSDQVGRRVGIFFSEVLGQSKVRERLTAGWAHAFVFWGFLVFTVSTLSLIQELVTGRDGFLHLAAFSWFAPVVDLFAFLIVAGIAILAFRRFVVRPSYLTYHSMESAVVLGVIGLIALTHLGERFLADPASTYFGWGHLVVAFSFLAYVPTSKHFHILGAPVNAVLQPLVDRQRMDPMDLEAELDFEGGETYGWNKVADFSWADRLNLITCIECGRCQEACPAYATGKLLNPRDFIVDLKYHSQGKTPQGKQAGIARQAFQASGESLDGVPLEQQPLVDHVIASQTLWECTSCMACVQACPVDIDHLSMLNNLRRHQVLDVGEIEPEYQRIFQNAERAGDPWGYGEHRKTETIEALTQGDAATPVPRIAEPGERFQVLFWVGCWGLYDDRSVESTRATLKVLDHYDVDYRILGDTEVCCGENYRRMGNELQFQMNAMTNMELFGSVSFGTLMVTNPHCHQVFGKDYKDFLPEGAQGALPFQVRSVEEVVWELVQQKGMPGGGDAGRVAYHDSCFYGRYNGIYDPQRKLVEAGGGELVELGRNREDSFCCGAGGGNFWREEKEPRVSWNRASEVLETGAPTLAVSCPFCMAMLEDGLKAQDGYDENPVQVKHVQVDPGAQRESGDPDDPEEHVLHRGGTLSTLLSVEPGNDRRQEDGGDHDDPGGGVGAGSEHVRVAEVVHHLGEEVTHGPGDQDRLRHPFPQEGLDVRLLVEIQARAAPGGGRGRAVRMLQSPESVGGGGPMVRFPGKTLLQQGTYPCRDLGPEILHVPRGAPEMGPDPVGGGGGFVGTLAGQELVAEHTDGVHVRHLRQLLVLQLLRAHVPGVTDPFPDGGEAGRLRIPGGHDGGDAEVGEERTIRSLVPEDVAGPDVPVHDPLFMGHREGIADVLQGLQSLLQGKPSLGGETFRQRPSLHVPHNDVRGAVGEPSESMNSGDVRMVREGCGGASLPLEATTGRLVERGAGMHHLDGHQSGQRLLPCEEDGGHRAGPQRPEDVEVVAQRLGEVPRRTVRAAGCGHQRVGRPGSIMQNSRPAARGPQARSRPDLQGARSTRRRCDRADGAPGTRFGVLLQGISSPTPVGVFTRRGRMAGIVRSP
ncbi:MAG: heterodisulfide reductase-related iron-sulfur binding cluster [Gemmatimonadota bacterium]